MQAPKAQGTAPTQGQGQAQDLTHSKSGHAKSAEIEWLVPHKAHRAVRKQNVTTVQKNHCGLHTNASVPAWCNVYLKNMQMICMHMDVYLLKAFFQGGKSTCKNTWKVKFVKAPEDDDDVFLN